MHTHLDQLQELSEQLLELTQQVHAVPPPPPEPAWHQWALLSPVGAGARRFCQAASTTHAQLASRCQVFGQTTSTLGASVLEFAHAVEHTDQTNGGALRNTELAHQTGPIA